MTTCFFVSDLHGNIGKYKSLFESIIIEKPKIVFLGGDLLPSGNGYYSLGLKNFVKDFLADNLYKIKKELGNNYPKIFIILGNDDPKTEEASFVDKEKDSLWYYIHNKKVKFGDYLIYGYNYCPPTPFQLKDWEKYDVSRYVDPGCISPEEGIRSAAIPINEIKFSTIKDDLITLTRNDNLSKAVFLFHSPPYQTNLDRANLDGKYFDHVPLDLHVGSIAIKKFIEKKQPMLTLHGHIHESSKLTGFWSDRIGETICYSAACSQKKLALIKFILENPANAERIFI